MSARLPALLVVALLVACGSDETVAAGDDTSSGSESSGSETQTQTETETETDEGEASSETDDGDETGETGEPVDPEAQDPCPVDACLCMSAPMELEAAPEVAGGRWDLDNDGWLERIRFESEPWQVYSGPSLFEAYMGIGEGVFEEDPTYGPLLPEQVFHVRDFIVSDIDGDEALDVVFEGGGLYYVPNAELFEEQLVEHWSPVQSWASEIILGTLGGDAHPSVFVRSYYYNLVEVLTFDPDTFSFEPRALLATDLGPDDIVFADLDNDGDGDLVTADIEAQGVSVFLWDAGEFAAPQRLPLAEVEELEGLPARGYVIARGGSTLFNLRADAGEAVLEQSGDIGPNSWGRLLAVDEGESMLWYRAPEYGYPNPGGLHVFYALCAGLDRSWTRSELPLWSSGEGHGARSWTFGDVNDDGLGDLSVRESIGMDVVIDWRLIRQ